jgi:3-oxoadipate enol-lactonase
VDLSGHGDSADIDTPPGPETLAAYAADVAAVASGVDADVLVGNSLGGAVVFETLHADSRLLHNPDETLREQSVDVLRSVGRRVTRRDFLTCHTFDVRDRLDEVDVPALAVVGEHDSLTPPSYHEYLAAELPDCSLTVIEDAAHLAMLEQPAAFNDAVGGY